MARVLIVEDEPSLARAVQKGLEDERHAVEIAPDGRSGLAAISRRAHDLVVLDVMLPDLDGLTVCRRARAAEHTVPILMLTARDTIRDVVAGLDAGADDYLRKPFAFEEFLARVRALLRGRAGSPALLQVGPLTLDLDGHRATCGGQSIELTAKEIRLLETFMLRPGRLLSKRQLTEILWDWEHEPRSNAIEVHLSSLRRKLAATGADNLFRTLRGQGYVLEEPRTR